MKGEKTWKHYCKLYWKMPRRVKSARSALLPVKAPANLRHGALTLPASSDDERPPSTSRSEGRSNIKLQKYLYKSLIDPKSQTIDDRRREFILNSLLVGLLGLSVFANGVAITNHFITGLSTRPENLISTAIFTLIVAVIVYISRAGHPQIAALVFQLFLLISATLFVLAWSYRLPEAQLVYAMMIVIAGVLFRATFALIASLVGVISMFFVASLQITGHQFPYSAWQNLPFNFTDLTGYAALFVAMGLVSWLSNHERDRSLQRALGSERALQVERDSLEAKVQVRTRELEELQIAELLEMQPYAEFGRIGSSLVHEIANPLSAARLQLDMLSQQQPSRLVKQAQDSLLQLEHYLSSARKQIKRESNLQRFTVSKEINQIVHLLSHRAQRAGVQIKVENIKRVFLYGDIVKFHQIIANLLANAIDASEKANHDSQFAVVYLVVTNLRPGVSVRISDDGIGISPERLNDIFKPFYTTKSSPRRGLGLGLSLVKENAEIDFNGSVTVTSHPNAGTVFTVTLRGYKQ